MRYDETRGARLHPFARRTGASAGFMVILALAAACADTTGPAASIDAPGPLPDGAVAVDAAGELDLPPDAPRPPALAIEPPMASFGDVLDCGGDGLGSKPVK